MAHTFRTHNVFSNFKHYLEIINLLCRNRKQVEFDYISKFQCRFIKVNYSIMNFYRFYMGFVRPKLSFFISWIFCWRHIMWYFILQKIIPKPIVLNLGLKAKKWNDFAANTFYKKFPHLMKYRKFNVLYGQNFCSKTP